MGVDITVRVFKYDDKENHYKELKLYRPGVEYHYTEKGEKIIDNPDFERVPVYDGRNSEMFDGMKDGDSVDGYGYFPSSSIKLNALEESAREEIEKKMNTAGYYDFSEINLAEMRVYLLEHPTVVEKGYKPQKENPIQDLFKSICAFCSFADNWDWSFAPLSAYKVVYYFNW